MRKINLLVSIGILILVQPNLFAKSIWISEQMCLGNALESGEWNIRYRLGMIRVGEEIELPFLLIFNGSYNRVEGFSALWSCPQLSSNVSPSDKNMMKWGQPGGDAVFFMPDPKDKGNYSTVTKDWRMTFKNNGKQVLIFNEQGWVYVYQDGSLITVESPTGRALNFIYNKGDLLRMEMTDPDGVAKPQILVVCEYDGLHRCVKSRIGLLTHQFVYNKEGLLAGWDQPNGESLNFYYDKIGLLNEVEKAHADKDGKLTPDGEPLKLSCIYMEPKENKVEGSDPRKNPANYFIEDDGTYHYEYKYRPQGWSKGGGNTPYYEVAATDKLGVSQAMRIDFKDNIFAVVNPYGKETKAVYYIGGPYDGKIRKLYQDGVF